MKRANLLTVAMVCLGLAAMLAGMLFSSCSPAFAEPAGTPRDRCMAVDGTPISPSSISSGPIFSSGQISGSSLMTYGPVLAGSADTYAGSYDTSTSGFWALQNGVTPSTTNYAVVCNSTDCFFVANAFSATFATKLVTFPGHVDITGVNAGNFGLGFNSGTDGICFNGSGAAGCTLGMQWVSGTGVVTFTTTGGRTDFSTGITVASGSRLALNGSANTIGWVYDGTNVALSATSGVNLVTALGSGTAQPLVAGVLSTNTTAVGNVGASGPDDLQTYTLPANSLIASGRCLKVIAYGTQANNTNAKTVRLTIGPTPTAMITKQLQQTAVGAGDTWKIEAIVCRTGASTQDYVAEATNYGGTTVSVVDGPTVVNEDVIGTLSQTETNALVIKTQSTVSTTDNDITSELLMVEAL